MPKKAKKAAGRQQPTTPNKKQIQKPDQPSKTIRSFKHCFRATPSPDIERVKKSAPPKSLLKINQQQKQSNDLEHARKAERARKAESARKAEDARKAEPARKADDPEGGDRRKKSKEEIVCNSGQEAKKCRHCGEFFRDRYNLNMHVLDKHPEKMPAP